jgi:uncharacterized protein with beta-barrel porin domain
MTSVRACPGCITGTGLASRPVGLRFRDAFLGTVAAGALSLTSGPALARLPAGCTLDATFTIETCTGDQSTGVGTGGIVTTLNVNNLTAAIAPAGGTAGINFTSGGAITINSNTGTFGITTNNADGIYANTSGNLTVTSTGNITTTGSTNAIGIFASSGGDAVTVTSTGNIATAGAGSTGILAQSNGAATVTSTGNITTAGSFALGIYALSTVSGGVTVSSTGNITTSGGQADGIFALGAGAGAVTVTSTGNITTAGTSATGIFANGAGAAPTTVTSTGNITTTGISANGINAYSRGAGAVAVSSTGNISTAGNAAIGIFAGGNGGGAVTVTSIGNIATAGHNTYGIFAVSLGAVTVTSTGNVTSAGTNAMGISASSTGGPIAITINSGTVSGGSGIGAGVSLLGGTNNTLTNMGTLTALSGLAISGNSGNNAVNNFGTVIGSVTLGTGTNAFNNMAGGFFNAGATVQLGSGDVLTNAGTLSPGGAGVIQTTALTGNLVQTTTGRLLTDINIGGGTSDRVNVSGTANLAGAVQLQVQNAILGPWQQTIVSAASGTTNNGLSLLASPALHAQLEFIDFSINFPGLPNPGFVVVESAGINFLTPGLNKNQTAVGNALNGTAQTSGLGGPVFSALLNTTSIPGYGAALTQLSGESATGSQQTTFDAMNMFMGAMTDPFIAGRGGPVSAGGAPNAYASEGNASAYTSDGRKRTDAARDAYAMFTKAPLANTYDPRWSVWAAGFGGSQSTDGNAAVGSNNTTSSIAGTVVGADYRFSPLTIAGFALAGGGTSFSVANGGGRSDLFQAGAYFRHDAGAAYITGALAYGWQDVITNRTVSTDQLRAEFNANAFSGRVEGGYRFVAPWVGGIGITPYAAAQFTTFDLPAYAETALAGSGAFALSYAAKSVTDPRSELGFRTDKSFAMVDGVLTLRGRLAWAHDYDTNRAVAATFQTLPGASFVVNGAAQASDSALVTASVEKKWLNGWSAAATFEGEFSSVTASYAGKGVVRYQW